MIFGMSNADVGEKLSSTCPGLVLDLSWTCPGRVLNCPHCPHFSVDKGIWGNRGSTCPL